jgi:hypothetical protein
MILIGSCQVLPACPFDTKSHNVDVRNVNVRNADARK